MAKHEQITAPKIGIFADISNADYHGGEGISKSGLDLIRKSPLHYKTAKEAGPRESTAAQMIGTILHDMVLEPTTFWDRYAQPFQVPEGALSTVEDIKERLKALGVDAPSKAKKDDLKALLVAADPTAVLLDDAKAAYLASVEGKTVISAEDLAKAGAMAEAIQAHPIARKLLAPQAGEAELSCYWIDKATDMLCRCRPDFWRHDGLIVDLKTCADASLEGFQKSLNDWRYYVQAPFYMEGISEAIAQSGSTRPRPKAFVFVAVEKTAPYAVAVYMPDAETMAIGEREFREDLAAYAACVLPDVWPGYGDKIQPIGLPEWRIKRELFNEEV